MSEKKQAEPQAVSAIGLIAGTDIPVFKGADGKYEVIGDPRNEVSANHLGDALREFFAGSFEGEEEKPYAYTDAAWNAIKANVAKDEHAHDFGPGHPGVSRRDGRLGRERRGGMIVPEIIAKVSGDATGSASRP
ncbi:hypothetical protein EON81_05445 [bacterium]|nr:MAG: hypothetical protein EON81_05445 [bacterium]